MKKIFHNTSALGNLPESVVNRFAALAEILLEANRTTNLTAVTEPETVVQVHFLDSLAGLQAYADLTLASTAVDIGSGAGFPLFPLAILSPETAWTACESIGKKCDFIRSAALRLHLANVRVYCGRAEELGTSDRRETFDVATARAVGPSVSLLEVGLPLLRCGGMLLLYKTESAREDDRVADKTVALLGAEQLEPFEYRFPADRQNRLILRYRKIAPTPGQYPRAVGVPFKRPLR